MEEQFSKAKQKANELGLTPEQIKAALQLFAYSENALKVKFYLKDGGKLGLKKAEPAPFKVPGTDGFDINSILDQLKRS